MQPPPPSSYGQPPYVPQQYVHMHDPQIQHQGCCSGDSQTYNIKGGRATGIAQLVLGFIIVIINVLYFVFGHRAFHNEGQPIGVAILFIIPTGIIGIMTKSRRNCMIIGYLVMSILSTVTGFSTLINEGIAVGLIYKFSCFGPFCVLENIFTIIILRAVCAVVLLIESIVAIVSSVYCCRGLLCCRGCCCCKIDGTSTMTNYATTAEGYYPQGNMMQVQAWPVITQTANPV